MKRLVILLSALLVASAMMLAKEPSKPYGIKSGTYTTVTELMGQKIESKTYFDDYGNLQSSKVSFLGTEVSSILRGGKMYTVDHTSKKVEESLPQESVNYLDLTDEIIAKYKIQKVGNETISGKECVKYTMEIAQNGQTAKCTVSVWRGIPIKDVITLNNVTVTVTVTNVTEEAVDPSVFVVPVF